MIATTSIPKKNTDIEDNNLICESTGCYKQATDTIKLEVGQFGQITIFLCKKCLPKFTAKGANM